MSREGAVKVLVTLAKAHGIADDLAELLSEVSQVPQEPIKEKRPKRQRVQRAEPLAEKRPKRQRVQRDEPLPAGTVSHRDRSNDHT